ncbi:TetR/AcrR family transcriptional regulator [Actinoplanes sp. CA-131856]
MATLRERKKLATWRTIRRAALELFEQHGYEAISVEQIAEAANVSRATFFNYFATKEAALFDPDPEERDTWRAAMASRPAEESPWDSVTAVMLGFNERLGDRMPLQRRLKAQNPALARSAPNLGEQFRADLRDFLTERTGPGAEATVQLYINLAFAAAATAYQTWTFDEDYDTYLERLRRYLHQTGAGVNHHRP